MVNNGPSLRWKGSYLDPAVGEVVEALFLARASFSWKDWLVWYLCCECCEIGLMQIRWLGCLGWVDYDGGVEKWLRKYRNIVDSAVFILVKIWGYISRILVLSRCCWRIWVALGKGVLLS